MPDNTPYIVIYCTVPDMETAKAVSGPLVEGKLAACVNIIPGIESVYSWKGEICSDRELLLIIKARNEDFNSVRAKIIELHPYEVPEIISLPIEDGHRPYIDWIGEMTSR